MRPSPDVRARLGTLAALAIVAVGLGVFDDISAKAPGSWLAPAAELGGPWVGLAFAGGYLMARRVVAAVVGAGLLTIAMGAFLAHTSARYDAATKIDYLRLEGAFWLLAAAAVGVAFGLCGWAAARPSTTWRASGFAMLCAFLIAEVLVNAWRAPSRGSTFWLVVEVIAAVAVAGVGVRRASARSVLPILALALVGTSLVALAAFEMFPLLGPASAGP